MIVNEDNTWELDDFINQSDDEVTVIPEEETEEVEVAEEPDTPEVVEDIVDMELGEDDDDELTEQERMSQLWGDITDMETLIPLQLNPTTEDQLKLSSFGGLFNEDYVKSKINTYWNKDTDLFDISKMDVPGARIEAIKFNNEVARIRHNNMNQSLPEKFKEVADPEEIISEGYVDDGNTYDVKYQIVRPEEGDPYLGYFVKNTSTQDSEWQELKNQEDILPLSVGVFKHGDKDYTVEQVKEWQKFKANEKKLENLLKPRVSNYNKPLVISGGSPMRAILENADGVMDKRFLPDRIIRDYNVESYVDEAGTITDVEPFNWRYTGQYQQEATQLAKDVGFWGTDMDIFANILKDKGTPIEGGLSAIGVILPDFLRFMEEDQKTDLNWLVDQYIKAGGSEQAVDDQFKNRTEIQRILYTKLSQYISEQSNRLKNYLMTNYLSENLDKFKPLIEAQNSELAGSYFDVNALSYNDWVNNKELRQAVMNSMKEDFGMSGEELLWYLNQSVFALESWGNRSYQNEAFPDYMKFQRDRALEANRKYKESKEKGVSVGTTLQEAGEEVEWSARRIWQQAQAMGEFITTPLQWITPWEGFDLDDNRMRQDYDRSRRVSVLPQATTSGPVAVVNIDGKDKKFLLDEYGQIWDYDAETPYAPEATAEIDGTGGVTEEGFAEREKIMEAFANSTETDWFGSWKGFGAKMTGISATLAWDIGMMYLTKNVANRTGLTTRYQNLLNKSRFVDKSNWIFNPKTMSLATNTAVYYGTTFALDGYNNTVTAALREGYGADVAHGLGLRASALQGTWGAVTSLFVPSNQLMNIHKGIWGFNAAARGSVEAMKKNGVRGFDNFWRQKFAGLNPTSQAVINRFYNVGRGALGELGQELSQQYGQEEWINKYLNSRVENKFLKENFSFQEAVNVGIYSSAAGGVVGLISNPDMVYNNEQKLLMDLYTVSKDPKRFRSLLDTMISNGDLDENLADDAYNKAIAIKNWGNKIPSIIKSKSVVEYAELMEKRQKLLDTKKENKDNDPDSPTNRDLADVNFEINTLLATNLNIGVDKIMQDLGQEFYSLENTDAVQKFIDKLIKENPDANITNDAQDFGNFITIEEVVNPETGEVISEARTIAIVNEEESNKAGFFTTGQHEGFHGLLYGLSEKYKKDYQAWKDNPSKDKGDAPKSPIAQMGISVLNYVLNTEGIEFLNPKTGDYEMDPKVSILKRRLRDYLADGAKGKLSDEVILEEVLPLLSESLTNQWLKIPEAETNKLADTFRSMLNTAGVKLKVTSGKDVLNLIKDYNKAVAQGGGLSRGLKRFAKGEVDVDLDEDIDITEDKEQALQEEIKDNKAFQDLVNQFVKDLEVELQIDESVEGEAKSKDNKASKRLTDLVVDYKKLLETDPNADPSKELLGQYTAASLAALYNWGSSRKTPVPFRQTFYQGNQLSEQGIEGLSMIRSQLPDIVRTYRPEVDGKKIEFTTYLDQTIGPRIGTTLVEEYARTSQQTSTEALQEKGFSPQTDTQKDFDAAEVQSTARPKVFPNKIKTISNNITGETRADQMVMLKNDIIEGVLRVGPKPKDIAKYIVEKTKSKEYRKIIKDKLGVFGSKEYIDNVNALFANTDFISSIPVANIKRRFGKLFGIKQTGTVPTVKVEEGKETRYDKGVYSIPEISDAKLRRIRNYFLEGEKRSQSLYSMIGEGLAVEAMEELKSDPVFMKELENRLSFRNSSIDANQFMSELNFDLDKRNLEDTSLDNVKASKKFNLSKAFLNDFSKIVLDKDINEVLSNLKITNKKLNTKTLLRQAQKEVQEFIQVTEMPRFMFESFALKQAGAVRVNPYLATTKLSKGETLSSEAFQKLSRFNRWNKGKKITNDYYYELNNGNWVKGDKVGKNSWAPPEAEWKNIKPGRGRLYWGKDDPAYTDALAATTEGGIKVMQVSRTGKKLVVNQDFMEGKVQDGRTRNEVFDDNMKALVQTIRFLNKAINEGVTVKDINGKIIKGNDGEPILQQVPLSTAALLIKLSYQATSGLIKVASKFKYYHKDLKPGQETREEHNPPASVIGAIILLGLKQNQPEAVINWIKKNYWQSQIPISEDNKINKSGLQEILPEFTTFETNTAVRLAKSGDFNLDKLVSNEKGKNKITLAEELKLPLDSKNQTPNNLEARNRLLAEVLLKKDIEGNDINKTIRQAKNELKSAEGINNQSSKQVNINAETLFNLLEKNTTTETSIESMSNADETIRRGNTYTKASKGISVFDFDDTLAFSDSKVIVEMPNGTIKQITPAEFARTAEDLAAQGAEFNFDQFNKVINGRKGPLADLALKRQAKFGSGDIFVLTARPQASAVAIKMFLDGIGLEIPLKNITGLENGSPEAKALWVLDKTKDGYNDFYFADDSLPNVQAVKNILDQIDIKSDVQQAKASKKTDLDKDFNVILEQQSGKEWYKTYSKARAEVEGKKKGRFEFFIPPSAEDFIGLMYKVLPKNEDGNRALKWIQDNLIDPFNKGEQLIIQAKMAVANDFKALKEGLDNIPSNLMSEAGYSNFTWSQALRVYIWNMQGDEIPGLSSRDKNALVKLIAENPDMKVFAEKIAFIQKNKPYPAPKTDWVGGSITSDILNGIEKVYRKEALQEWLQNVEIIFSPKNMAKLEALYGKPFIIALKNILGRMKRGSNRPISNNAQVDDVIDWLNASVGTTMFLNRKSALLQLISNVNFINWTDNNILEAGKAFANQPQYWRDVLYLLNSDYLTQRRNGLKINVAESEIAEAAKKGGFKGAIAYLLNKGFIFTRIADSLAIATGGATFYRNRVNSLLKTVNIETGKLYTQAEAEAEAFNAFYKISEETQQSSRTDRISMQQASGLGRLVLNYANTPMQYSRIMKRATLDLLNGRGDWRSNVSKILYYGLVQNLIFTAMQQALFSLAFVEDDDDLAKRHDDKSDLAFSLLSNILRGLGYGGALVDTLVGISREINKQSKKKSPDYEEAVWKIFDYSPSVDTKVRKLRSAANTWKYNRKEIERRGFSLENPAYLAVGQIVSAGLNIPLDRALRMSMAIKQISDKETETWQRFALAMGYTSWSVGLPYWGTLTTVGNEKLEDDRIKAQYKKDADRLKSQGFKRIPMTRGKPSGELGEDYIEVFRPSGDKEYWLMPKK